MEEVDKIIIQSLISIGCNINQEISSIGQFDQDLFIESVAKLLNIINSSIGETLPTKLPPNTAVKFRICSKFANVLQSLGYKNDIGYQTFLYSNENESRRLLTFLVEKLSKESTMSIDDEQTEVKSKKSENLNKLISDNIKNLFDNFWLPHYLKINGLRNNKNNILVKEGCKFKSEFLTVHLNIKYNLTKFPESFQNYLNKHLKYVHNQSTSTKLFASLHQKNTNLRIKELSLYSDLTSETLEEQKKKKEKALNELKNALKITLNNFMDVSKEKTINFVLNDNDLFEINNLKNMMKLKKLVNKGSRFQHSEKLQFSNQDDIKKIITPQSNQIINKEEEVKKLKDKLESLTKLFETIEKENTTIISEKLLIIGNQNIDQVTLNKQLEEKINLKKKTSNLINNAPMNILKLKEEIKSYEKKRKNLIDQWESRIAIFEETKEKLKKKVLDHKLNFQQKFEEVKEMRSQINDFNDELNLKENLINELSKEIEKLSKLEKSSKTTNRQFYTKRILEICSNIDKQRVEINKILIETKLMQKEINQLSGKLERIFNETDELLYKDAKQAELNKKVYKIFININTEYEKLLQDLEQTSLLDRENRDLEDQINLESQNKIKDNIERVLTDLKQIKQENDQLLAKLKKS